MQFDIGDKVIGCSKHTGLKENSALSKVNKGNAHKAHVEASEQMRGGGRLRPGYNRSLDRWPCIR